MPQRDKHFDVAVSGLVLNFLPDPGAALSSLRTRVRPGGTLAAYVWDYSEGMEFLKVFWEEAVTLNPQAAALDEGRRFPLCRQSALESLWHAGGLRNVESCSLEISTNFANFEDYWTPFTRGTGPAPSYVASLSPPSVDSLRERLQRRLPVQAGGIHLLARGLAVRGVASL